MQSKLKTDLCREWELKGSCIYGPNCGFAHGKEELHQVARYAYKTKKCNKFWKSGYCPYGRRCLFLHAAVKTSTYSSLLRKCMFKYADKSRLFKWLNI